MLICWIRILHTKLSNYIFVENVDRLYYYFIHTFYGFSLLLFFFCCRCCKHGVEIKLSHVLCHTTPWIISFFLSLLLCLLWQFIISTFNYFDVLCCFGGLLVFWFYLWCFDWMLCYCRYNSPSIWPFQRRSCIVYTSMRKSRFAGYSFCDSNLWSDWM